MSIWTISRHDHPRRYVIGTSDPKLSIDHRLFMRLNPSMDGTEDGAHGHRTSAAAKRVLSDFMEDDK